MSIWGKVLRMASVPQIVLLIKTVPRAGFWWDGRAAAFGSVENLYDFLCRDHETMVDRARALNVKRDTRGRL